MSGEGVVHCARCGDYKGDDWTCPECGVQDHDEAIPTAQPPARTRARKAGQLVGSLCVLTAMVLVAPPAVGLVAKVVWRSFLWGWGLIP